MAGHRGSGYISHFGTLRKMMGKLICRDKQNLYPFPLQLRIPVLILPKASIRFKCPVAPKYSVDFRDPNSPSSEGSIKAQIIRRLMNSREGVREVGGHAS